MLFKLHHPLLKVVALAATLLTMYSQAAPAVAQTCTENCLSVFSNVLVNRGTYLHGTVKLWDETHAGAGARGTVVHAQWTRPDGTTLDQYANIGTRLRAEFRLYGAAEPGSYSLTVLGATKLGYTFDPRPRRLLTSTVTVAGSANQTPIAVINANTTSGIAPLSVNFDSTGSNDPDGTIIAYAWNFGDGGTSTDANPSHTYFDVGNFSAELTVTDDMGTTNSSSIPLTVSADSYGCALDCTAVDNIALRYQRKKNQLKGLVWLVDENATPVNQAVVHGVWTLPDGSMVDQVADTRKRTRAKFTLVPTMSGLYKLTIVKVTKAGHTFDPDNSNVLDGLIEVAP